MLHPRGDVRLLGLRRGKVVPGGLEQDAPQLLRRLLLHGGVQQEVRPPGDRRHVVGLRCVEEEEHDLTVDVAQILRVQPRAADQVPIEAAQRRLRLLLLPVPDPPAQLRQPPAVLRRSVRTAVLLFSQGPRQQRLRREPLPLAPLLHDLPQHLGQLLQIDGLFHIADGLQPDGPLQVLLVRVPAEKHHLAPGTEGADGLCRLQPRLPGHLHVTDEDVRAAGSGLLHRLVPVGGLHDLRHAQLRPGQMLPEHHPGHRLVVRDQNRQSHAPSSLRFFMTIIHKNGENSNALRCKIPRNPKTSQEYPPFHISSRCFRRAFLLR